MVALISSLVLIIVVSISLAAAIYQSVQQSDCNIASFCDTCLVEVSRYMQECNSSSLLPWPFLVFFPVEKSKRGVEGVVT